MGKAAEVDYSLYLVTDSTAGILGNRDLCDVVDRACRGGVTVVQYRDKTSDTGRLVSTARALHAVARRHAVPLLINDRVDVALAVGCEGVHIGQDDMDLPTARRLLGPDAIIGVSVGNAAEALEACAGGADYIGIGTVFATSTKTNTKTILGVSGVREVLATLADQNAVAAAAGVRTVCIGGINATNAQRVVYQSAAGDDRKGGRRELDGVAVVSAVIGAPDPEAAAEELRGLVRNGRQQPTPRVSASDGGAGMGLAATAKEALNMVPAVVKAMRERKPLSHNMTNLVVQNFAANVALAVGASPIMANYGEEAADLCKLGGALVVNMGTVTPEGLENYKKAIRAYNAAGLPIVFDPVGAGATHVRRAAVQEILNSGYLDIIKGNEGEIKTVYSCGGGGETPLPQQRGVDSTSSLDDGEKAELVRRLAARERNVVVMTGKVDYLSDGRRVWRARNGHAMLGEVTGTGCALGTIISAAAAVWPADRLVAALAGTLIMGVAAESAANRADAPGSYVPALLDQLFYVREGLIDVGGQVEHYSWFDNARVEDVEMGP